MNKKTIFQVAAVVIIIGAIIYIEIGKPHNLAGTAQDIQIAPVNTTSTLTSTSVTSSTPTNTPVLTTASAPTPTNTPATAQPSLAAGISADIAAGYSKAKEITDPTGFINSPNGNAPFTLSQFAGNKVILVDFWTYSCINCERTIPYLNAWYQKYKDYGLVIVGVHTPEFDFEKVYANVAAAVKQYGIAYPVVLDSNMGTWDAYQNQYWPHEYLIDVNGYVVHDHIGEGEYDVTEEAIQSALKARDQALGLPTDTIPTGLVNPASAVPMNPNEVQSPETYFGANRNEYLANGGQGVVGAQTLSIPAGLGQSSGAGQTSTVVIQPNSLYLDGTWNFQPEYAESVGTSSKILYDYNAKNVYFVAAASSTATGIGTSVNASGVKIDIKLDGISHGSMIIQANKLYTLIQGTDYGEHVLEIDVEGTGLEAYTFTFG